MRKDKKKESRSIHLGRPWETISGELTLGGYLSGSNCLILLFLTLKMLFLQVWEITGSMEMLLEIYECIWFIFYETCSLCKLDGVIESQIKLRLFGFSLTGRAKDWLYCSPSGTIQTWTELEDGFLKRFFITSLFVERRDKISKFEYGDTKYIHESRERFKFLLRRCANHNMDNMDQMQVFTRGLKV